MNSILNLNISLHTEHCVEEKLPINVANVSSSFSSSASPFSSFYSFSFIAFHQRPSFFLLFFSPLRCVFYVHVAVLALGTAL